MLVKDWKLWQTATQAGGAIAAVETAAHGTRRGAGFVMPVIGEALAIYALISCVALSALPIARGQPRTLGAPAVRPGPRRLQHPRAVGESPRLKRFLGR